MTPDMPSPDEQARLLALSDERDQWEQRLAEAEQAGYERGRDDGWNAGREHLLNEQARAERHLHQRLEPVLMAPDYRELEERRYGPGGRKHFADPRPEDRIHPRQANMDPTPEDPAQRLNTAADRLDTITRDPETTREQIEEAALAVDIAANDYDNQLIGPHEATELDAMLARDRATELQRSGADPEQTAAADRDADLTEAAAQRAEERELEKYPGLRALWEAEPDLDDGAERWDPGRDPEPAEHAAPQEARWDPGREPSMSAAPSVPAWDTQHWQAQPQAHQPEIR